MPSSTPPPQLSGQILQFPGKNSSVPFHCFKWTRDHILLWPCNIYLGLPLAPFNVLFPYFCSLNPNLSPLGFCTNYLKSFIFSFFLQQNFTHHFLGECLLWKYRPAVLWVWSLDQQRAASPGTLWEMQILRPHPRLTESETLGMGPSSPGDSLLA